MKRTPSEKDLQRIQRLFNTYRIRIESLQTAEGDYLSDIQRKKLHVVLKTLRELTVDVGDRIYARRMFL